MKNLPRSEKILRLAVRFLVLSMILMVAIIPFVLTDPSPGATPKNAVFGVSLAILIRLVIFLGYLKVMRDNRRSAGKSNRQAVYIVLGAMLLFLGLIYTDGAFAFLGHEHMLHVSVLMFCSVLFDFVAGIMTIVLFFLKPGKGEEGPV